MSVPVKIRQVREEDEVVVNPYDLSSSAASAAFLLPKMVIIPIVRP